MIEFGHRRLCLDELIQMLVVHPAVGPDFHGSEFEQLELSTPVADSRLSEKHRSFR